MRLDIGPDHPENGKYSFSNKTIDPYSNDGVEISAEGAQKEFENTETTRHP